MFRIYLLPALLLCAGISAVAGERVSMDLNGTWQFRTDPKSVGVQQEWHSPGVTFPAQIQVPGAWQAQGIGEPDGVLRHSYSASMVSQANHHTVIMAGQSRSPAYWRSDARNNRLYKSPASWRA